FCAGRLAGSGGLLPEDNPFSIWSIIAAGVATVVWLEGQFRWARWVGGPTLGLLLAALLSNLGILPRESAEYAISSEVIMAVAIALLLLRASPVEIVREARGMIGPFAGCCA